VAKIQQFGCSSTKSTINDNPYIGNITDNKVDDNIDPNPNQENSQIEIYPNPTTNNFTINTHNDLPIVYKIYTLQGKLLQTGTTKNVNTTLPKGMYLIVVINNNKESVHKIIIN